MVHFKADAIVVAWQSSSVLRSCLEALRADPAIDQIVVVNNSPEDPVEPVLSGIGGIRLINSATNLGFGSGVNLGKLHVTRPFVVLANPDAEQSENTTTQLLEFMVERPRAAVAAPRMVHPNGSLYLNSQHDVALLRMLLSHINPKFAVARTPKEHTRAHITDYVIASFVAARVEALDAVGWFDSSIFMFGEDQDICRRLRKAGWEIWYAPLGRVRHMSGHSWRQIPSEAETLLVESRYRELNKARGRLAARAYLTTKSISDRVSRLFRSQA